MSLSRKLLRLLSLVCGVLLIVASLFVILHSEVTECPDYVHSCIQPPPGVVAHYHFYNSYYLFFAMFLLAAGIILIVASYYRHREQDLPVNI